jgi:hypothetical protein
MFKFFDGFLTRNKFGFFLDMFKMTFIHLIHLSTCGLLSMVFKQLWDSFDTKDLINDFSKLFLVCSYVVTRRILGSII